MLNRPVLESHRKLRSVQQSLLASEAERVRYSPFLKWAGGKGHSLKELLRSVPPKLDTYHEPFLGGGALFFAICNKRTGFVAHLSDSNEELVNAYRVIKKDPDDLIASLTRLHKQFRESRNKKTFYYEIRKWKPTNNTDLAARFTFLNKTCYNGLYRVNSRGEFNVPYGDNKNATIFTEDNILATSKALRDTHAVIDSPDYKTAIKSCSRGDFVYLDPPYDPSSKTAGFTDYTISGFSKNDQSELADAFADLVERGCIVLLSNSDTPFIRMLYRGYDCESFEVSRPISCLGKRRRGFRELIVSSSS